jgi:hypothetical protein
MITTPTVSGKPGQASTGLSCNLYPLIGSQHLDRSSGSRHRHFKTLKPCCQPFAPKACFAPDASTLKDGDGHSRVTSAPSISLFELGDSMTNLLCVIGRHEWQTNYDTEVGRLRSADGPGVITFEATLRRTGHTPDPIQHRGRLSQTSTRVRTSRTGPSSANPASGAM